MAIVLSGRRVAAAALAGMLASPLGPVAAQSPPQQPPQEQRPPDQRPPTIRTGTELVRVDVTVLDPKGEPVPSLTADDFEVREDSIEQKIQSFKFVAVNGYPEQGDEMSLPIRSKEHAAAEAARDDVRVFLIFWDEYHIDRLRSANLAREHLTRFVRTAFGPKDLVAFMDPLTPTDEIRFTRNRMDLAEHVRTLQGRSGVYVPARSVLEEAHMYSREGVERLRSQVTLTALTSAAAYLGTLRQGRKSIIFISEGMRGLGFDEARLFDETIRTANDSNTAVYTLNPQGLTTGRNMRFDFLRALADNTGAEAFSTNDFEDSLQRVVTQSAAYYLLGYSPEQRPLDGRFHRIRVRVKRSGLEVRARSGYWAPTVADMQRAEKQAAQTLPVPIASALAELIPPTARRSVDLWIGTALVGEGQPGVRLFWSPRRAASETAGSGISAVSVTATSGGVRVFAADIGPQGGSFEAPAGPLELILSAKNSAGEIIEQQTRTVAVPNAADALWISSPVVIPTSTPLELKQARADPAALPSSSREFERTERLLIRFDVHGAAAADATVTGHLLNQQASELTTLPVTRSARGTYEMDVPLQSIVRGDFVIAIRATGGSESAASYVPIRIVR